MLPEGANCALWGTWADTKGKWPISQLWRNKKEVLHLLLELQVLAGSTASAFAASGGQVKRCEAELVSATAIAYAASFRKKPSAYRNGVFMNFISTLAGTLAVPGGKEKEPLTTVLSLSVPVASLTVIAAEYMLTTAV